MLAPTQVRGFLGDTTELPCKLQPLEHNVTVTQVTWTRQKLAEAARSVAVFHPTQGPSFPEPGRLEFVAARPGEELRDASLAVRGLRAEDEGNYTCQFATFPNGDRSARTWLRVLGEPGGGGPKGRGVGWGREVSKEREGPGREGDPLPSRDSAGTKEGGRAMMGRGCRRGDSRGEGLEHQKRVLETLGSKILGIEGRGDGGAGEGGGGEWLVREGGGDRKGPGKRKSRYQLGNLLSSSAK